MTNDTDTPETSDALRVLDALVGTWRVSGGATGTTRYEWLDGGHFLLQHVDLVQDGHHATGLEVIGHLRPFGEDASPDVHSRFYDNRGNTFDYVYRLDGRTLRIWAGEVDSPVRFVGELDEDGRSMTGSWDYAGQGGYSAEMVRVEVPESGEPA